MSTQPTKAALTSQAKAKFLAASKRTYQAQITAGLNAAYASFLAEGEEMPNWDLVQDLQERALESAVEEVARADEDRREARAARTRSFAEARRLATANRRDLRGLQHRLSAAYGPGVLADVRLDGPLEKKPRAVLRQKEHVRDRLADSELELPKPMAGLAPIDRKELVDGMKSSIRSLADAVTGIDDASKRADEALLAKNAALERLRIRIVNVGREMEGQCRLVGLDDVADRLRLNPPAGRKSNMTPNDAPENGSTSDLESAAKPEPGPTPEMERTRKPMDKPDPGFVNVARSEDGPDSYFESVQ